MVTAHRTGKDDLLDIAHEAMLQRELLPGQPGRSFNRRGVRCRDSRLAGSALGVDRPGDSGDLDQLTVA
jgi:hypothetical protein